MQICHFIASTLALLVLLLGSPSAADDKTGTRWSFLSCDRIAVGSLMLVVNADEDSRSVAVCLVEPGANRGFVTHRDPRPRARWVTARGGDAEVRALDGHVESCVTISAGELELAVWHLLTSPRLASLATGRELERERAPDRIVELSLGGGNRDGTAFRPILVIAGGVTTSRAVELVTRWAASSAQAAFPTTAMVLAAPADEQSSERLSVLRAAELTTPVIHYGWRTTPASFRAMQLASFVLAEGHTSRFGFDLVHRRQLALATETWWGHYAAGSVVAIRLALSAHATVDRAQRFVDGSLKQLRLVGPTPAEFGRARVQLETQTLLRLQSPLARARELASYELGYGDANELPRQLDSVRTLTPDAIRQAALLMRPLQRNVVEVYPSDWPIDDPKLAGYVLYTVRPGDDWYDIARRFRIPLPELVRDNDLDLKYRPTPGHPLWIAPGPSGAPRNDASAPLPAQ